MRLPSNPRGNLRLKQPHRIGRQARYRSFGAQAVIDMHNDHRFVGRRLRSRRTCRSGSGCSLRWFRSIRVVLLRRPKFILNTRPEFLSRTAPKLRSNAEFILHTRSLASFALCFRCAPSWRGRAIPIPSFEAFGLLPLVVTALLFPFEAAALGFALARSLFSVSASVPTIAIAVAVVSPWRLQTWRSRPVSVACIFVAIAVFSSRRASSWRATPSPRGLRARCGRPRP